MTQKPNVYRKSEDRLSVATLILFLTVFAAAAQSPQRPRSPVATAPQPARTNLTAAELARTYPRCFTYTLEHGKSQLMLTLGFNEFAPAVGIGVIFLTVSCVSPDDGAELFVSLQSNNGDTGMLSLDAGCIRTVIPLAKSNRSRLGFNVSGFIPRWDVYKWINATNPAVRVTLSDRDHYLAMTSQHRDLFNQFFTATAVQRF